jgi:hypothetical protein
MKLVTVLFSVVKRSFRSKQEIVLVLNRTWIPLLNSGSIDVLYAAINRFIMFLSNVYL